MSWEYIRLGDVCTKIGSGATPKGGATAYIDEGTSFIRSQNIYNLEFSHEGLVHITEDAAKKLNGVAVQKDDVLINITGDSVARTCMVPDAVLPARVNQHVAIVRPDSNRLNPRFLNYYLTSPYMQSLMLGLAVGKGASRNAMTKDMIANFDILCPPIEIQESIVGILSTYDALIENNQRQIKLLEEAAQRLYKEWFVDLRFPGHENTKITDGIPERWRKYKFSDTTSIMSGGTPKTDVKEFYNGNIPFYTPKDSDDSFFAFDTITHISQSGLDNCNSQLYPVNTVIITARGTVGKTTILAVPMAMNQSCYALKCDELNSPYYLFFSLKNEVAALKKMANGGVFNTIIVKTFDSIYLIAPTQDVLNMFEASVSPIMEQIKTKARQNIILTEARDRLLPKLMSGEIEL